MKKLTTLILTIIVINVFGQTVDSLKLKSAMISLIGENTKTNQINYFELFPNSFENFEKTFGYEDGKVAPLYFDSHQYVSILFDLDSIPIEIQIEKWINISIGGHWDADAVNYFQHGLRPRILMNVDLSYEILKKRTNQDIESFFYFFFNEIHPQVKTIPNEFEDLKIYDNVFYKLIEKGNKRAIKDSGH